MLCAAAIVLVSAVLGIAVNAARPGGISLKTPPVPASGKPMGFEEVWQAFDEGKSVFIDARPAPEYIDGHIRGAVNVPHLERQKHLPGLLRAHPPDTHLIVYCDGLECEASKRLSGFLLQHGWRNVYVFTDGFPAWLDAGLETVSGDAPE